MKTKFSSMKQAVQFAFAFQNYAAQMHVSPLLTRSALAEAGVTSGDTDADEIHLGVLRSYAKQVFDAVRQDLAPAESASLEAAFSRDWSKKRLAVTVLSSHFKAQLSRTVDNIRLIDALVTRHYIAVRERRDSWTIPALGEQYRCNNDRVSDAAVRIDHMARALEDEALANVQRILEHKGVMPHVGKQELAVQHG